MNSVVEEELDTVRPDPTLKPKESNARLAKNSFHPLKLFTDNAWAARMWFLFSLLLLGFIIVQPFLIIEAYRSQERVVILDPAGTFSIAPTMDFQRAEKLHEEIALWSTHVLFSQNPNGFDMPELLEKMYLDESLKQAKRIYSDVSAEFKEKNIHQKVEVFAIKVLKTRENKVLVKVDGQLIRTGSFEGKVFVEDPEFTVNFVLYRNPDMLKNKRFPLAVSSFEEKILL